MNRIKIGYYEIVELLNGNFWIYNLAVLGEGGEFKKETMEKLIEEFYRDNF